MRCKAGSLGANRKKGWNINLASQVSSFGVASQTSSPSGVFVGDEGSLLYVSGYEFNSGFEQGRIYQYSLPTPWSLSGATLQKNLFVGSEVNPPTGFFFSPDGLGLYVCGDSDVKQYGLTSAWDLATASYASKDFQVQSFGAQGVFIRNDGIAAYVACNSSTFSIEQYDLSTPWDISSASFVRNLGIEQQVSSVSFHPSGTRMFLSAGTAYSNTVSEYSLTTEWDISTAQFVQRKALVNDAIQTPFIFECFFGQDGAALFASAISVSAGARVYKFNVE
jgi:DNA-binding beta-propeller fold protein YncE